MTAYQFGTATGTTDAVFDALGDGTRRAILDLLSERPRAVGELAAELPVSRPAVSLHLRVLRHAGLVQDTAAGTRRIYRLDPAGLTLLRTYLDRVWAGALRSFAEAAEAAHRSTTAPADHHERT
ncbi:MAG TPA: metalloregulator ArsR/SmtB family transcription factor [Acidimicrobiales bacterium]|nr:metalloregulator ArsR/SmtB family transcription factor [Acidimicrobiales bacterium]